MTPPNQNPRTTLIAEADHTREQTVRQEWEPLFFFSLGQHQNAVHLFTSTGKSLSCFPMSTFMSSLTLRYAYLE